MHWQWWIRVRLQSSFNQRYQRYLSQIRNEAEIMKALHGHPAILQFIELLEVNDQNDSMGMVMQLVQGGTLKERIQNSCNKRGMRRHSIVAISRQLASALAYMHRFDFLHRDIKPDNVLLLNKKEDRVVVSDFGLACVYTDSIYSVCGTVLFQAPELVNNMDKTREKVAYSGKVDVWALGITIYSMVYCVTPWELSAKTIRLTPHQIMRRIMKDEIEFPQLPTWISELDPDIIECVQAMCIKDQYERSTMEEAIEKFDWLNETKMDEHYHDRQHQRSSSFLLNSFCMFKKRFTKMMDKNL